MGVSKPLREHGSINVSLTPELEQLVSDKVKSGLYNSASEVVREALRLLKEQDAFKAYRLEELRREIAVGIAQADRGDVAPLDMAAIQVEGRKRLGKK